MGRFIKYLENLMGAAIFEGLQECTKTFWVILPQICVSILCNDYEMRVGEHILCTVGER